MWDYRDSLRFNLNKVTLKIYHISFDKKIIHSRIHNYNKISFTLIINESMGGQFCFEFILSANVPEILGFSEQEI